MQSNNFSKKTKTVKRVGRGGKKGTYSGKGMKGQSSRSGYSRRPTFEGGRSSLVTQAKKNRGFKSRNEANQVVNVGDLEKKFENGETVNPLELKKRGLIKKADGPVKILSSGEVTKKFVFENVLLSKEAEKKTKK